MPGLIIPGPWPPRSSAIAGAPVNAAAARMAPATKAALAKFLYLMVSSFLLGPYGHAERPFPNDVRPQAKTGPTFRLSVHGAQYGPSSDWKVKGFRARAGEAGRT